MFFNWLAKHIERILYTQPTKDIALKFDEG